MDEIIEKIKQNIRQMKISMVSPHWTEYVEDTTCLLSHISALELKLATTNKCLKLSRKNYHQIDKYSDELEIKNEALESRIKELEKVVINCTNSPCIGGESCAELKTLKALLNK